MNASWLKTSLLVAGMVAGSAGVSAYAQDGGGARVSASGMDASHYVMRSNEIAGRLAPIKSVEDLDAFMTRTLAADSPLNDLSPAAKSRFLSSLQFNEKGLTSFGYADLRAELTPSQIYRLLSLFGVQRTVPLMKGARVVDDTDRMIMASGSMPDFLMPYIPPAEDHEGYRCVGQGSCARAMDMICTGNC